MKSDPEVLRILNDLLTNELTAINQYFIHAKLCRHWGFTKLASKIHAESIDEMKHAEMVTDRILYFEGIPNFQRYNPLRIGETVPEQFEADLRLEYDAVERLNRGIAKSVEVGDNGTRDLLEGILVSEEEHVDWLETQLDLVAKLGEQLYLSEQMSS